MKFSDALTLPCGLRFMYDALELCSGAARRVLLESRFITDRQELQCELRSLQEFLSSFISGNTLTGEGRRLQDELCKLKDIRGTLAALSTGHVLEDIDLFELKSLALISAKVREIIDKTPISNFVTADLLPALDILDPLGERTASFYIYDCYDERLAPLRRQIDRPGQNHEQALGESMEVERQVREKLSKQLKPFSEAFESVLEAIAHCDILLAKAVLSAQMNLSLPEISESPRTCYTGLFHPETKSLLEACSRSFQSVDICFGGEPTIITGANMGGKTVVLKMIGLGQLLFQFGFAVPAESASLTVRNTLMVSIGESDGSRSGLSSFGVEVRTITDMISCARTDKNMLVVIDEPARTTNPAEGAALAGALIRIFTELQCDSIITTHYDLKNTPGHKLRVTGLEDGVMDYRLIDTDRYDVPREALNTAEALGADPQWITLAAGLME